MVNHVIGFRLGYSTPMTRACLPDTLSENERILPLRNPVHYSELAV